MTNPYLKIDILFLFCGKSSNVLIDFSIFQEENLSTNQGATFETSTKDTNFELEDYAEETLSISISEDSSVCMDESELQFSLKSKVKQGLTRIKKLFQTANIKDSKDDSDSDDVISVLSHTGSIDSGGRERKERTGKKVS